MLIFYFKNKDYHTCVRQSSPTVLYKLLFLGSLIVITGCSSLQDTSYIKPTPEATLGSNPTAEAKGDAVNAGVKLLETQAGTIWLDPPKAEFAEEMSYEEASKRIGMGDGQYDVWPKETRVWFTIFSGRWQLLTIGPAQTNPQPTTYKGCLFLVFTVSDTTLISQGDSVCPAN